ncbi:alpha/beta fold hydrolase [Humitalea sp. 24SJ18S-53]|uniref:alpha/beta fold hydrolase n=1 Tax=Humitalea sp. 24SJ18S-53 TaxID=3422307 RepID=UPI003D6679D2
MLMQRDGRNIAYDLIGGADSPTVCLVHSLAADSGMWAEQIPALLDAGYAILRIDLRGHGGSAATPGPYRMEDLAADTAFVLGRLRRGPVHYVGLSLGGMSGQALALDHPGLVRSLMICDALPASLPNATAIWGPRVAAVRAAGVVAPVAQATIERWLTPEWHAANPARWQQILDTIAATDPEGYVGCVEAIRNFTFVARLPSLAMPVCVVCGEKDSAVPPSEGERIAALVPNGRFHAIAGAMHLPNVEKPEAFNRVLLDWLAANQ